jgi:hypothetical protein
MSNVISTQSWSELYQLLRGKAEAWDASASWSLLRSLVRTGRKAGL